MARRLVLRENEVRVISVTPVGRGFVRPGFAFLTAVIVVQYGVGRWSFVQAHHWFLLLTLSSPGLVVTLTRLWRWRSHKVHVTSERVVVEGGVVNHFTTSIELRDVIATRVEQLLHERLSRRGIVVLETASGSIVVGRVRHPAALCRLIDRERLQARWDEAAFDTVFEFEDPVPPNLWSPPRAPRHVR